MKKVMVLEDESSIRSFIVINLRVPGTTSLRRRPAKRHWTS